MSFLTVFHSYPNSQGYHGQGKISGKGFFFQVREKSGNFVDGQGGLGKSGKSQEI